MFILSKQTGKPGPQRGSLKPGNLCQQHVVTTAVWSYPLALIFQNDRNLKITQVSGKIQGNMLKFWIQADFHKRPQCRNNLVISVMVIILIKTATSSTVPFLIVSCLRKKSSWLRHMSPRAPVKLAKMLNNTCAQCW